MVYSMKGKPQSGEYRTTMLCIDSYENGVATGRFYHPCLKEGEPFQSLTQLLLKLEVLLEADHAKAIPQARVFDLLPVQAAGSLPDPPMQKGALATFLVHVVFRQNASWQGSFTCLEEGREQRFRSVLELIRMMDGALNRAEPEERSGFPLLCHAEA